MNAKTISVSKKKRVWLGWLVALLFVFVLVVVVVVLVVVVVVASSCSK